MEAGPSPPGPPLTPTRSPNTRRGVKPASARGPRPSEHTGGRARDSNKAQDKPPQLRQHKDDGNVAEEDVDWEAADALVYSQPWLAHDSPGPKYQLPSTLSPRGPVIGSSSRTSISVESVGPGPGAYVLPSDFTDRKVFLPDSLIRSDLVPPEVLAASNQGIGLPDDDLDLGAPYDAPSDSVGAAGGYAAPTAASKFYKEATELQLEKLAKSSAPNAVALRLDAHNRDPHNRDAHNRDARDTRDPHDTRDSPRPAHDKPRPSGALARTRGPRAASRRRQSDPGILRRTAAKGRRAMYFEKELSPESSHGGTETSPTSSAPFLTSKDRFKEDAAIEHHSPGPKYMLPSSFGDGTSVKLPPQRRRQRSLPPALRKGSAPSVKPPPMVPPPEYPDTPEADVDTKAPIRVFDVYSCCRYPRYPTESVHSPESKALSSYFERRSALNISDPKPHAQAHAHTHAHAHAHAHAHPHGGGNGHGHGGRRTARNRKSARRPKPNTRGSRRSRGSVYEDDGTAGDTFITKLSISRNRNRRRGGSASRSDADPSHRNE